MPLMATVGTESPTRIGMNRLVKYGLFTIIVAIVANVLVRMVTLAFVSSPADFVPLPLGWGPVVASSALGAIGATVVYGVITRVSQRPNRTFTIIATVGLVLSLVPFFTLPPAFAAALAPVIPALVVMHVIVAAASVVILTRSSKSNVQSEAR